MPEKTVSIEIPAHLLEEVQLTPNELKTELAVQLYQQERLSLDQAAELAGILVQEFQDVVDTRNEMTQQKIESAVAKRTQEIDDFALELLHRLAFEHRAPLTAIEGFSQLLLEHIEYPLSDEQEQILKEIRKNGQYLQEIWHIIEDSIRVVTDTVYLNFEEVNLEQVARRAYIPYLDPNLYETITFRLNIAHNFPTIWADKWYIEKVLDYLVRYVYLEANNSIDFSAKPNDDMVTVEIASHAQIPVHELKLLPQAKTPAIWRMDYKIQHLAISQHIVRKHGGEMHIQNHKGGGSTITFTLPVYNPEKHAPPES